jgi:putative transposase
MPAFKRVAREAPVRSRKPCFSAGRSATHRLRPSEPDRIWVADITYIRTLEGFAYLAVVIDLYSRRVVGWSVQSRQTTEVVLQALLMAVWRGKPKNTVLIHSDQGSQFTSMDWASFLKHHNLEQRSTKMINSSKDVPQPQAAQTVRWG